ncbi:MAG: stage III sporulation protein AB [Anaerotignum sp.]|nr:stage III sporulation protein AB [Anaerotignum sp.]
MIRWLGALLVLGTSLWLGAYFSMKEKYRLQELEQLEKGLLYLQGQIRYLSAPLAEALADVGWKTEGMIGEIFQKTAENLAEHQGDSAEEVWRKVWQEEKGHTFLIAEDMDALLQFGRSLGYLDKAQQENSINLFLRYVELALEQGRKRQEKNGRLYYGMGGLCGLLVVVTLF